MNSSGGSESKSQFIPRYNFLGMRPTKAALVAVQGHSCVRALRRQLLQCYRLVFNLPVRLSLESIKYYAPVNRTSKSQAVALIYNTYKRTSITTSCQGTQKVDLVRIAVHSTITRLWLFFK